MKKTLFAIAFGLMLLAIPSISRAHDYDRDDSDYPLRYVSYVVYPVGIAVEYVVLRPIHWLVSRRNLCIVFGHDPSHDTPGEYMEWE